MKTLLIGAPLSEKAYTRILNLPVLRRVPVSRPVSSSSRPGGILPAIANSAVLESFPLDRDTGRVEPVDVADRQALALPEIEEREDRDVPLDGRLRSGAVRHRDGERVAAGGRAGACELPGRGVERQAGRHRALRREGVRRTAADRLDPGRERCADEPLGRQAGLGRRLVDQRLDRERREDEQRELMRVAPSVGVRLHGERERPALRGRARDDAARREESARREACRPRATTS